MKLVLGAVISIALLGGIALLELSKRAPLPTGAVEPQAARSAEVVSSEAGKASADTQRAVPAPLSNLRQVKRDLSTEFSESTNLRAFIDRAVRRPEAGGVFLSRRALDECGSFRAGSAGSPLLQSLPHDQAQRMAAAKSRLEQRCSQLLDSELLLEEVHRVDNTDVVLRSFASLKRFAVSKSPEARAEAISDLSVAIIMKYPEVVERLGLVTHQIDGIPSFYFDGKFYPLSVGGAPGQGQLFSAASQLAACTMANTCAGGNSNLLLECATGTTCPNSIMSMLRGSVKELGEESFQSNWAFVEKLGREIEAAVENTQPERFIPPISAR